jgi:hypothetical protein
MKKVSYWGKPKHNVSVNLYTLYVGTQKGSRQKWAGECSERVEIDNRLNRYFENNDYVSAKIVCKYKQGQYIEYIKYCKVI